MNVRNEIRAKMAEGGHGGFYRDVDDHKAVSVDGDLAMNGLNSELLAASNRLSELVCRLDGIADRVLGSNPVPQDSLRSDSPVGGTLNFAFANVRALDGQLDLLEDAVARLDTL